MEIVNKLPNNTTTRPYVTFWKEVASLCREHPGEWVLVDVPGSISSARAAYGIRKGQYRSLRGFEASRRDKRLYVRYNPDTYPDNS